MTATAGRDRAGDHLPRPGTVRSTRSANRVFFTHDRAATGTVEVFAGEVMPRFERLRPPAGNA